MRWVFGKVAIVVGWDEHAAALCTDMADSLYTAGRLCAFDVQRPIRLRDWLWTEVCLPESLSHVS